MYGQTGTGGSSQLNIEQQAATVSWMKALGPKTVLCVDDEKIGLRVRKILLESHGFKVLTASSGAARPRALRRIITSIWSCSTTTCPA